MDNICGIGCTRISINTFEEAHSSANRLALRVLNDKRLGDEEYNPDAHKESLIEVSIEYSTHELRKK